MTAKLPCDRDDLQSEAYMALVEAAGSFDPSRNVNFATYARYRIRGALLDARREILDFRLKSERMVAAIGLRVGGDIEYHGRLVNAESNLPVGAELETLDTVKHWINKVPRPLAPALRHVYLEGKTQEETAALLGCSPPTLCRMHSQAIAWLQHTHKLDQYASVGSTETTPEAGTL
jgi:RNA polymerase sigma factor (sigma-70 family)